MTRIYVDLPLSPGSEFVLPPAAARHVVNVLRLKPGATITLFNGRGGEYVGELVQQGRREAIVALDRFDPVERETPLAVTLVQGISRGERMDYSLQKAVELGVRRIVPFNAERTTVKLGAERARRRLEHWRGIIRAACEQSGRNRLAELADIQNLDGLLAEENYDRGIVLDPSAAGGLERLHDANDALLLVVGPEGGLAKAELERLGAAGFTRLKLGPRVLRTETATVVGLSILQSHFGDLHR